MKALAPLLIAIALSACGESGPVNPPTEPAQPIEAADPGAPIDDGTIPMTPGRGPRSFVGRWAADVAWCAAPEGDGRPIEITATRFEGYENSCAIGSIDEVADGYVATLACVAEGTSSEERVKMSVAEEVLTLTYLDRSGEPVELRKCTTLADTVP
jgi:predicted small lipoprotein YifL